MNNRRTGKIARLTQEWREIVNTMLLDGATYAAVIERVKEVCPDLAEQNLTNWKDGGYQDWLKLRQRLEDIRFKRDMAMEVVKANDGGSIHEAAMIEAGAQLYEVISEFDTASIKELLIEAPENYAHIVNSLAKLSKGTLDNQKYRDFVREQRDKALAALNEGKAEGGLTSETIAKIERELRLL